MWSPLIEESMRSRVSQQMMNVQDWLPTLHSAAGRYIYSIVNKLLLGLYSNILLGGKSSQLPSMDGLDMWDALTKGGQSPRNLMLHNIDDSRLIAAVRVGDWKFIRGGICAQNCI